MRKGHLRDRFATLATLATATLAAFCALLLALAALLALLVTDSTAVAAAVIGLPQDNAQKPSMVSPPVEHRKKQ